MELGDPPRMIGKRNPNKVETADDKTPETNANEPGDALNHLDKKTTCAEIYRKTVTASPRCAMPSKIKRTRGQVGEWTPLKARCQWY